MTDIQNKVQEVKMPTAKVAEAETAKATTPIVVAEPKAAAEVKTESK